MLVHTHKYTHTYTIHIHVCTHIHTDRTRTHAYTVYMYTPAHTHVYWTYRHAHMRRPHAYAHVTSMYTHTPRHPLLSGLLSAAGSPRRPPCCTGTAARSAEHSVPPGALRAQGRPAQVQGRPLPPGSAWPRGPAGALLSRLVFLLLASGLVSLNAIPMAMIPRSLTLDRHLPLHPDAPPDTSTPLLNFGIHDGTLVFPRASASDQLPGQHAVCGKEPPTGLTQRWPTSRPPTGA